MVFLHQRVADCPFRIGETQLAAKENNMLSALTFGIVQEQGVQVQHVSAGHRLHHPASHFLSMYGVGMAGLQENCLFQRYCNQPWGPGTRFDYVPRVVKGKDLN